MIYGSLDVSSRLKRVQNFDTACTSQFSFHYIEAIVLYLPHKHISKMLQTKRISKVLSQGLKPISKDELPLGVNEPLSLSLLSHSGLPLTTVSRNEVESRGLTVDNLRIYSLLAMNQFKNATEGEEGTESGKKELSNWVGMAVDKDLHLIIQKVDYAKQLSNGESGTSSNGQLMVENNENDLYVVIFYTSEFPHAIAKLKIDNVCNAVAQGLEGYS